MDYSGVVLQLSVDGVVDIRTSVLDKAQHQKPR
jgi:hypothetical protein